MRQFVRLLRCERAAAAAELAMMVPLLVLLLAGLVEFGHYFYAEHRLVEGVRDAARYAARQPYSNYASCPVTGSTPIADTTTLYQQTEQVAKKGTSDLASSDTDRLWGWDETGEVFTVSYQCFTSVSDGTTTTTLGGIWTYAPGGAPVVTVDARLPHKSIFAAFGFEMPVWLNASQQAAVMGA